MWGEREEADCSSQASLSCCSGETAAEARLPKIASRLRLGCGVALHRLHEEGAPGRRVDDLVHREHPERRAVGKLEWRLAGAHPARAPFGRLLPLDDVETRLARLHHGLVVTAI